MIKESQVAVVSERCEMPCMEDGHFLNLDFLRRGLVYGGVYDGHGGGEEPAKCAMNRIHRLFAHYFLNVFPPADCFTHVYSLVSAEIGQCGGVCAADFVLIGNELHYANVGDAKIWVIGDIITELTVEHSVTNPNELFRLITSGATVSGPYIFRDAGTVTTGHGLMPSRTLGDLDFKAVGVIAEPSTGVYEVQKSDRFILAATDGLGHAMMNTEILSFAQKAENSGSLAESLKRQVMDVRQGGDNLTIIVIEL